MIKKILLTATLVISLFASEYKVENDYSNIKFEVSKLLFLGVSGEFTKFRGTIKVDKDNKLSRIEGIISINSINTEDVERDNHLKASDYFNVGNFPNIVFKSNDIRDDRVKAMVSIKGIEKELIFIISDLTVSRANVSFKLSSTVDRQQFMLNGSKSGLFADDIEVTANLTAVKKK